MLTYRVTDWENAYANMPNIPNGEAYPGKWQEAANFFRKSWSEKGKLETDIAYDSQDRARFDLFLPAETPRGLVVFIHGGYWMRFDKSSFSHLAEGPLRRGWAVAMPSYELCPQSRISQITRAVGKAVETAAEKVDGPLRIAGHSAGGHLASRLACQDSPLAKKMRDRLELIVSISGVHDLRPLLQLELNETLRLDIEEARDESPALNIPLPGTRLICWVGAGERAEFLRNNALLANIWTGLGAATACVEEPDRHHFDVVEGLADPESAISHALVGKILP